MNEDLFRADVNEAKDSAIAPDWRVIEIDYRAGIKALRQIASENGITEAAIRKRAKRDDWTRDLSERIQAKAVELVRKEEVRTVRTVRNSEVRKCNSANHEAEMVKICSNGMANVILKHRDLSERIVNFGTQLLTLADDEILDIEKKARTFKTIVDSIDCAARLQRQAWGMDAKGGGHNALELAGNKSDAIATLSSTIDRLVAAQQNSIANGTPAHKAVAAVAAVAQQ